MSREDEASHRGVTNARTRLERDDLLRRAGRRRPAAANRRRADRRMPIPTRFITTISGVILRANVGTLSTVMIGNTDSTM